MKLYFMFNTSFCLFIDKKLILCSWYDQYIERDKNQSLWASITLEYLIKSFKNCSFQLHTHSKAHHYQLINSD